jgi:hypothetical protein
MTLRLIANTIKLEIKGWASHRCSTLFFKEGIDQYEAFSYKFSALIEKSAENLLSLQRKQEQQ